MKCFREVMQVVDPMLDEIRARSYGNALRELGIFAVIMKEVLMRKAVGKRSDIIVLQR